jgi:hypothetical protein
MSIEIGAYVEGERPEPLEYQFLDADGVAVNLTGFTATFRLQVGDPPGVSNAAAVATPLEGKVTYTWAADDLVAGALRAEFVVTNGTNTYVSDRLVGVVRAAIEVA